MIANMNDNPINQIAFDWLVRADRGLTPAEQAELAEWLAADARHNGAFIRAKAVFNHARRIRAFADSPDPDTWVANVPSEKVGHVIEIPSADNDVAITGKTSRRAFLGLAGGLAAAGIGVAFLATGDTAHAVTFRTKQGERRQITLADGTAVTLNTQSEIRVLLGQQVRSVRLMTGEVLFEVAPDKHRPFIVDAVGFQARAEGTSFSIQQLGRSAPQLVVREGVVDVTPANATSLEVGANTRVTIYSRGRVFRERLTAADLDRELMWREGKIAFEDTPLASAIDTFGRYGSTNIDVEDPALMNLTITGVFSSDDPMGFATVVAQVFDLQAIPEGRGITLRKKN